MQGLKKRRKDKCAMAGKGKMQTHSRYSNWQFNWCKGDSTFMKWIFEWSWGFHHWGRDGYDQCDKDRIKELIKLWCIKPTPNGTIGIQQSITRRWKWMVNHEICVWYMFTYYKFFLQKFCKIINYMYFLNSIGR